METCTPSEVCVLQKRQKHSQKFLEVKVSDLFSTRTLSFRFPGCWSVKVSLDESRGIAHPSAPHPSPSPASSAGGFTEGFLAGVWLDRFPREGTLTSPAVCGSEKPPLGNALALRGGHAWEDGVTGPAARVLGGWRRTEARRSGRDPLGGLQS